MNSALLMEMDLVNLHYDIYKSSHLVWLSPYEKCLFNIGLHDFYSSVQNLESILSHKMQQNIL